MTTSAAARSIGVTDRQAFDAACRSKRNHGDRDWFRTVDELSAATGACDENCIAAIERCQAKGWLTEGNPRWAWPTKEGEKAARGGAIR